jgi:hypothetical protein
MSSDASSNSHGDAWPPENTEEVPVQLPLDTIPSEFEAAVAELKQRSRADLKRARKHHRRALTALEDGAYDALPDETRTQLTKQLHTSLAALNEALNEPDASEDESQTGPSSLLQKATSWLW